MTGRRYFFDSLSMVLRNLKTARLRVWLTVLGIALGAGALIAVTAIGRGGSRRVELEMGDIGIHRVWLYPSSQTDNGFDQQDAAALTQQLREYAYVSGTTEVKCEAEYGTQKTETVLVATQSGLPMMEDLVFSQGRFFSAWEEANAQDVIVLEGRLAKLLFPQGGTILGERVALGGHSAVVVGVVEKRTARGETGMAYVPAKTYGQWYGDAHLDYISLVPKAGLSVEGMAVLGKAALQGQSGIEVRAQTLQGEREIADTVLNVFSWVIYSIAIISLLVGGTGIMNVMYMTVQTRTREIGIRKAIGATNRQITLQFLQESAILAAVGGLIGCGLGSFMAYLSCTL
ncbi:MAG: ABC transporter permease, partial [Eubacteriales bacterium]|nr:ABC transporter permease [Eubacteriales bacterium]